MDFRGIGVGRGLAVGPVLRMPEPLAEPRDLPRSREAAAEWAAVESALAAVAAELAQRGARAGGAAGDVLEASAMMAQDPALVAEVRARIDGGKTGERAVFEAFSSFQGLLEGMGGLTAERATDLGDVRQRVVARLRGVPAPGVPESEHPFVLVAADLAPADTELLDLSRVLAVVTRDGGPTSHTSILTRARSIPTVVRVADALELVDGVMVVVDAAAGTVLPSPSSAELQDAARTIARRRLAESAPITPGALADGTAVPLLANLGSPEQAAAAIGLGAEGVGLFRTELLFVDWKTAPTIAEQREQYTELLARFAGRRVVARVFDAGADKPLAFLEVGDEPNPALGLRGLRALRVHERVLSDQLTALAQAAEATDARLEVMAPMVADVEEAAAFVDLARGLGLSSVGVMVEVPSLAMLAAEVMQVADFVSIGTNDLTQYALAADRQLGAVAQLQDPWHPAVLRLVQLVGRAGMACGKPVGICGEAAADPELAVVLVGLGATTLSMTPAALADVRAELLRHSLEDARRIAERVVSTRSAAQARAAFSAPAGP